jgi:hypothetical protein
VLITVDGLRWQELFSGIDAGLLGDREKSGVRRPKDLLSRYDAQEGTERRVRLFPFFWDQLVPGGVLLGDRDAGSAVSVSNPHWISYPGYAELLTGRVQEHIKSNDPVPIGLPTILDFLKKEWGLKQSDVAVFASWERFQVGASQRPGDFVINAGYQELPHGISLPDTAALIKLQEEMRTPWDDVRHDRVTMDLSLEYVERYGPRVLYVALGETDDWAHERRYDRVIQAAHRFDRYLKQLWTKLQSLPTYRNNTLLVITTDHGRGVSRDDWTSHKAKIKRSNETWFFAYGPGVPAFGSRVSTKPVVLAQVAATILRHLGIDPARFHADIAPAIQGAFPMP